MNMGNCKKEVRINGKKLKNTKEIKFLGLTIDHKLTLKKHIQEKKQCLRPGNGPIDKKTTTLTVIFWIRLGCTHTKTTTASQVGDLVGCDQSALFLTTA